MAGNVAVGCLATIFFFLLRGATVLLAIGGVALGGYLIYLDKPGQTEISVSLPMGDVAIDTTAPGVAICIVSLLVGLFAGLAKVKIGADGSVELRGKQKKS